MAIALDVATNGGFVDPGTSRTWSHTCSGSDRILVVHCLGQNSADRISGVTYNSVAMSRATITASQNNTRLYIYTLVAPSTGANNVVVTISASTSCGFLSVSYTGAQQSGQPDEVGTNTTAGASTLSSSISSQNSGAWLVGCFQATDGTGSAYTAGSNTTERVANNGYPRMRGFDSNATTTTSQTYNWTGTDAALIAIAEILESGGGPSATTYNFMLLGVGG